MSEPINIAFTITVAKIETMADGGLKIVIHTPELAPDAFAKVYQVRNTEVKMLISDTITEEKLELLESVPLAPVAKPAKSASQRLRAVLFRLWEQSTTGQQDFEAYYDARMERLIDHYKSQLN